jgi:hypothetical protein
MHFADQHQTGMKPAVVEYSHKQAVPIAKLVCQNLVTNLLPLSFQAVQIISRQGSPWPGEPVNRLEKNYLISIAPYRW